MKKLKYIAIAFALMMTSVIALPTSTYASQKSEDIKTKVCEMDPDGCSGSGDLFDSVGDIINFVISIVGILAVIMIIMGGITLTMSSGDPGKVKKGKDTILYGIIGLVVVLLAFAIVNFVLKQF